MNPFNFNFTPSYFNYYSNPYYPQFINLPQPQNPHTFNIPNPIVKCENQVQVKQQFDVKQDIQEDIKKTTTVSTNKYKCEIKQETVNTVKNKKGIYNKEDSQYQPEISNFQNAKDGLYKQKYLKKNTESNICNQAFSYLTTKYKSLRYLQKILQLFSLNNKQTINIFYQYIIILKNYKRKYVNKKFLLLVGTVLQNKQICKRIQAQGKVQTLSIEIFGKIIRILLLNYLNQASTSCILTSKKIEKITLSDHFNRRRKIAKYLLTEINKYQKQ